MLSTVTKNIAVFGLAAAAAEAGPKLLRKARWGRQDRQDEVRRKSRVARSAVSSLTSLDCWSGPTLKLPPAGRFCRAQAENRTTSTAFLHFRTAEKLADHESDQVEIECICQSMD